ncbi:MAG: M28 family peptidase [Myxococcota bacterium]|nr:M28 family peptidase [Myxococcota bacterium]
MPSVRLAASVVCAAALGLGCANTRLDLDLPFVGGSRPAGSMPGDPSGPIDPDFSGEAAFGHLQALYDLGPRPTGSAALAEARSYLSAQLEPMGAEVVPLRAELPIGPEGAGVEVVVLTAEFEGASKDSLLLVAPLDTATVEGLAFAGANEGASGPAVLIELARVLTEEPLPYTLRLAFPDGERVRSGQAYGSEILVATLEELDALQRVRAVVYLGAVGDRDLRIERDGNSNRRLRAAVYDAAPAVGRSEAFPAEGDFVTPDSGHMIFTRLRVPALLLNDGAFGGEESPGVHWRTEQDTPELSSAESLEAVGDVLAHAIRAQTGRWQRIDSMMASSPDEDEVEPAAEETRAEAAPASEPDTPGAAPASEPDTAGASPASEPDTAGASPASEPDTAGASPPEAAVTDGWETTSAAEAPALPEAPTDGPPTEVSQ